MAYQIELWQLRLGFYGLLILWSFLLLCLCGARINYTTHLSHNDPLNGGRPFTDPSVGELLFTSIITLLFAPSLMAVIHRRIEHDMLSKTWFEIAGLWVLWMFWLGGTAAATDVWPASLLSACVGFAQCQLLQALLAFAWLGWITLTALLFATMFVAVREQSWYDHTHGDWSRKQFSVPMRERESAAAPTIGPPTNVRGPNVV